MFHGLYQTKEFACLMLAESIIYSSLLEQSVPVLVQAMDDGEAHILLPGL